MPRTMTGSHERQFSLPGELQVRVATVERDVGHLETSVNAIRDTMATRADIAELTVSIKGLSDQQQLNSKPNYSLLVSVVGVAILFLTMMGGFAYWPIATSTGDLKSAVAILAQNVVMQKQYDRDQDHIVNQLVEMQKNLVTRSEHEEKWKSFEVQHSDLKVDIANSVSSLQRQIDVVARQQSDIYNARDVLLDLRQRLNQLETKK